MGIYPDTFHCCMILHESVCGGGATLEPTCCNQSRVPLCVVSVRVCSTVTPEPGSNDPSVCRSPMTKRQSILCNLIQSDRKQQLDNDQHIMENWAKVQWRVTSCETKWWMIIAQILSVGKYFARVNFCTIVHLNWQSLDNFRNLKDVNVSQYPLILATRVYLI